MTPMFGSARSSSRFERVANRSSTAVDGGMLSIEPCPVDFDMFGGAGDGPP